MNIILATPEVDLRLGLQLLLSEEPNVKIAGTASTAEGVLALIKTTPTDLVLLDSGLSGFSMSELAEQIHAQNPNLEMIILVDRASLLAAPLHPGVRAYLLKGEPPEKLLQAFRRIAAKKFSKLEDQEKENSSS